MCYKEAVRCQALFRAALYKFQFSPEKIPDTENKQVTAERKTKQKSSPDRGDEVAPLCCLCLGLHLSSAFVVLRLKSSCCKMQAHAVL